MLKAFLKAYNIEEAQEAHVSWKDIEAQETWEAQRHKRPEVPKRTNTHGHTIDEMLSQQGANHNWAFKYNVRPRGGPEAQRPRGPEAQRPRGQEAKRHRGQEALRPRGPEARNRARFFHNVLKKKTKLCSRCILAMFFPTHFLLEEVTKNGINSGLSKLLAKRRIFHKTVNQSLFYWMIYPLNF